MNPAPPATSASPDAATPTKLSPSLFGVALLLAISVLINYVDRGTLAIAAPLLKEDLHLSASQLGILLSAFFWTYAPFQIVSGWLVDKFDVNWLLGSWPSYLVVRNADDRPSPRLRSDVRCASDSRRR